MHMGAIICLMGTCILNDEPGSPPWTRMTQGKAKSFESLLLECQPSLPGLQLSS